ncbi:hypothetical protein C1646_753795 [Rhizophagus diaphanus]|nr:hypothetical protein C1646_753795 [Rhizophagus diaphanus] [Rhizophagus sp. MUCL 43196]
MKWIGGGRYTSPSSRHPGSPLMYFRRMARNMIVTNNLIHAYHHKLKILRLIDSNRTDSASRYLLIFTILISGVYSPKEKTYRIFVDTMNLQDVEIPRTVEWLIEPCVQAAHRNRTDRRTYANTLLQTIIDPKLEELKQTSTSCRSWILRSGTYVGDELAKYAAAIPEPQKCLKTIVFQY